MRPSSGVSRASCCWRRRRRISTRCDAAGRDDETDATWQEAEPCLIRALEMSQTAQAKSLELRAATSLARAWQGRGRVAEARSALAEICEWFDASLATPDLIEARALLGELAGARESRRARARAD